MALPKEVDVKTSTQTPILVAAAAASAEPGQGIRPTDTTTITAEPLQSDAFRGAMVPSTLEGPDATEETPKDALPYKTPKTAPTEKAGQAVGTAATPKAGLRPVGGRSKDTAIGTKEPMTGARSKDVATSTKPRMTSARPKYAAPGSSKPLTTSAHPKLVATGNKPSMTCGLPRTTKKTAKPGKGKKAPGAIDVADRISPSRTGVYTLKVEHLKAFPKLKEGFKVVREGRVFKHILKIGDEGRGVHEGARVCIEFAGFIKSRQSTLPLVSSRDDKLYTFVVRGTAPVYEGLTEAIETMTAGEQADFYFHDASEDFGAAWDPNVKPDPLYVRVEVLDIECFNSEKPWLHDLSKDALQEVKDAELNQAAYKEMKGAAKMLSLGKGLLAVSRYKTAIRWLKEVKAKEAISIDFIRQTELLAKAYIRAGKLLWDMQRQGKTDRTLIETAVAFAEHGLLHHTSCKHINLPAELAETGHLVAAEMWKYLGNDLKALNHWSKVTVEDKKLKAEVEAEMKAAQLRQKKQRELELRFPHAARQAQHKQVGQNQVPADPVPEEDLHVLSRNRRARMYSEQFVRNLKTELESFSRDADEREQWRVPENFTNCTILLLEDLLLEMPGLRFVPGPVASGDPHENGCVEKVRPAGHEEESSDGATAHALEPQPSQRATFSEMPIVSLLAAQLHGVKKKD